MPGQQCGWLHVRNWTISFYYLYGGKCARNALTKASDVEPGIHGHAHVDSHRPHGRRGAHILDVLQLQGRSYAAYALAAVAQPATSSQMVIYLSASAQQSMHQ